MNLVNIVDPQNEKKKSELCLGIDFGTTNSVCSIKKDNKIVFVEDFDKKLIPSIILFKKNSCWKSNTRNTKNVRFDFFY